jgi:hypothetical protein
MSEHARLRGKEMATAVWSAIVTLATVGYGDVVPQTGWGGVIGCVVIIFGVTFITFLTAVVTSLFVEAEQDEHRQRAEDSRRLRMTRRVACRTTMISVKRWDAA